MQTGRSGPRLGVGITTSISLWGLGGTEPNKLSSHVPSTQPHGGLGASKPRWPGQAQPRDLQPEGELGLDPRSPDFL